VFLFLLEAATTATTAAAPAPSWEAKAEAPIEATKSEVSLYGMSTLVIRAGKSFTFAQFLPYNPAL